MALIPTKWVDSTLEVPAEWADYTEQVDGISTNMGYYVHPQNQDEILIKSTRSVSNKYGIEMRRDIEEWQYEIYKGPPIEYNRECYSNVYLPGIGGRRLRRVETEKIIYWPFTPFTDGDNLGRTRLISGYVVYDLPADPDKPDSSEEQDAMQEASLKPGTKKGRVVHSGKLWVNANLDNNVIPEAGKNQTTIWVDDVIVEHDVIDEQPDRWIIWTVRKHALRSGAVEVLGPKEIKKTGFAYRLPYPIGPPTLTAGAVADGVALEADGGGAHITNRWLPQNQFVIKPEKYKFYRKKLSEPARSPEDDPYGWWKTPPTVPDKTAVIENTSVTDFAGGAASALPGQTSYTEPHDPEPVDPPEESAFKLIATVDNANDRDTDEGYAFYLDQDVISGAEYEYYCTAVIRDDESPDSNHEIVTYNGVRNRHYRITKRVAEDGSVETDALAPDDPGVLQDDLGELLELEVPTTDDPLDVTEEIADRLFATTANEDLTITMDVLIPLLGLEHGQRVEVPQIVWEAFGNDIHLISQTIDDSYVLRGFRRKIERNEKGVWSSQRTTLTLEEHRS